MSSPEHRHFRDVLGHFPSGVAVVTGAAGGEGSGLTVQAFCSLSLDPPLVLVCPARGSTSWPRIEATGQMCVNLLADDQEEVARRFSMAGSDKFGGLPWTPSPATGSPVLEGSVGFIDCSIEQVRPGGDHLVVIGRVLALDARNDRRPLIFYRSRFGRL